MPILNTPQQRLDTAVEAACHEHAWITESQHWTSEGQVLYVRCRCGVRRIDRQWLLSEPPVGQTRIVGG